jgi:hypothetical protein
MQGMPLAPLAELLELKPAFQRLLILVGIIVRPLAVRALEFDEVILGHGVR